MRAPGGITRPCATEARRERPGRGSASIRLSLDVNRKTLGTTGAYVSTGAGGTTIHYAHGCTLQGYERLRHIAAAQVLVDLGLQLDTSGNLALSGVS
jgi:hypothetical protein